MKRMQAIHPLRESAMVMGMNRAVMIFLCVTASVVADDRLVRESGPLQPQKQRDSLQVPEGFEVQLFAAEPMINKPINIAFDDQGRLWVSSTVEYPYAAEKKRWSDEKGSQVAGSRDAIKILEDIDSDGRADRVIDFAEGLNIPTGVLPWHKPDHKMGCIAWSIPNIWYLADTTGDGHSDHREVLFGPLGYEKDTHGMCSSFRLGADGWVYATHGFNNTSQIVAKDGSTLDLHSGNVFRFRTDASQVEIWSWGQVNPFGLTFDRRGNLYSADCHSAPVYQLLRGAHYPSFGKPHDGLGFAPAMIEHTHGSTGIAGIVYLDNGIWGDEWDDHILIGNPVTSRVNADRIEFVGSTPKAIEKRDFVVSRDPWFRPVDLTIGPEGALYIADFYNRIIGHYEVPLDHPGRDRERGRIWRIVKTEEMKSPTFPQAQKMPEDPIAALIAESPFDRRLAVESIQDSPSADAVPALITLLETTDAGDTHLIHAAKLALRECLRVAGAFSKVGDGPIEVVLPVALAVKSGESARWVFRNRDQWKDKQKSCLIHLGHCGDFGTRQEVIEAYRSDKLNLTEQMSALNAIAGGLEERGTVYEEASLMQWAGELAKVFLEDETRDSGRTWKSLPNPEGSSGGGAWVIQKRKCEDGKNASVLSSLRRGESQAEQRTGLLRSRVFSSPSELRFWICGHRGPPEKPAHDKSYVCLIDSENNAELVRAYPPRSDVCHEVIWDLSEYLGRAVRIEIVDGDSGKSYAWLGIARIDGADGIKVDAFSRDSDHEAALRRLAELLKVSAPADLRDRLRPFLPSGPQPPPREISSEQRKNVDKLIVRRVLDFERGRVDIDSGKKVFQNYCAACHRVAGEGGITGPQLDGIGNRGVERLAEDILDPNRNVDAHFRATLLTMKDGSLTGGFIVSEKGQVLQMIDGGGVQHRLLKSDIAKRETSDVSLMPPNFGTAMSENDFRNLLGWLLQQ